LNDVEPYSIMFPISFHPDPAVNAAYMARLSYIRGELHWNNTPAAFGDFDFLLWVNGTGYGNGEQDPATPVSTGNVRFVQRDGDTARQIGANASMNPLNAWVFCRLGVVAPQGLPVRMVFDARFE
jgi:hypothetical protein